MKKLNITKEQFNRSRYFTKKYGTLKFVSESGKTFKTSKGRILKFNESSKVTCDGCGEEVHDDTVEIVGDQVLCDKCRAGVKKESHNDIENDPAYECPYCGGHNCEFQFADDTPIEGYFDGANLVGTWSCLDCEKNYNVTFQLNVVDVK